MEMWLERWGYCEGIDDRLFEIMVTKQENLDEEASSDESTEQENQETELNTEDSETSNS